MTTEPTKKSRQMPKGGRKGGSSFPRIALGDAIKYAKKLVSKTHTSAQPIDVIHSGVVGHKGGMGDVRVSALKQYGFLKGDKKSLFSADELAKKISAAPHEELIPLYRIAILKPAVFKKLFDTFQGDVVSKAKLKQRAADLKVHPDETPTCVELYVIGMTIAGLVTVEGDQVKHLRSSDIDSTNGQCNESEIGARLKQDDLRDNDSDEAGNDEGELETEEPVKNDADDHASNDTPPEVISRLGPRAVFNVNVSLDSSLDIEKLQKQLELLKRFGAI